MIGAQMLKIIILGDMKKFWNYSYSTQIVIEFLGCNIYFFMNKNLFHYSFHYFDQSTIYITE